MKRVGLYSLGLILILVTLGVVMRTALAPGSALPGGAAPATSVPGALLDVSGSGIQTRTTAFTAPLLWSLTSHWTCDTSIVTPAGNQPFIVLDEVVHDASTHQTVDTIKFEFDPRIGNFSDSGSKRLNIAGKFYLQITSVTGCNWHVVAK